jgi:hypothetical protein
VIAVTCRADRLETAAPDVPAVVPYTANVTGSLAHASIVAALDYSASPQWPPAKRNLKW